ncbi:MAG: hypothetical protein U9N87_07510, partial [Planctomycetota bacterium]|nr:hypothetical protein [Planctomycetota bacterium]
GIYITDGYCLDVPERSLLGVKRKNNAIRRMDSRARAFPAHSMLQHAKNVKVPSSARSYAKQVECQSIYPHPQT